MSFIKLAKAFGTAGLISTGVGAFILTERKVYIPSLSTNKYRFLLGPSLHASMPREYPVDGPADIAKRLTNEKAKKAPPPPAEPTWERKFELTRFGLPCDEHTELVKYYRHFIMEYDTQKRQARWVLEHIKKDNVKPPERKLPPKPEWKVDSNYKFDHRPSEDEWAFYNEFDISIYRKQLACPRNYNNNQDAFSDTYYTSNCVIVPNGMQTVLDIVDNYVRSIAKVAKDTYVITGPLFHHDGGNRADYDVFGGKEWGPRHVPMPIAIYKIVLSETDDGFLHLYSFIVPCSNHEACFLKRSPTTFLCSFDKLKQLAAIDDFPNVPMEEIATINNQTNPIWSGAECVIVEEQPEISVLDQQGLCSKTGPPIEAKN